MITSQAKQDLKHDIEKFQLKYKCHDCAHVSDTGCSLHYPKPKDVDDHSQKSLFDAFCKYFELS